MAFGRTLKILTVSVGMLVYLREPVRSATLLDWEGLADGTTLSSQLNGLTFVNTILLSSGISLNEFEFPPHSGSNVVSDDGGPITVTFSTPVLSVSGYFTYLTQLTFTAFDASDRPAGQVQSAFGTNLALSGDPGSAPNELLHLIFAGGISKVIIAGDPTGGSFTLDDLAYGRASSPVPEPSTFILFLTAVAMIACRRGQKS